VDELVHPCLRDEDLAEVLEIQCNHFYQQAKVAAEATGAAVMQHDGRHDGLLALLRHSSGLKA